MSTRTDPVPVPPVSTAADADRLRVNKLDILERLADDLAHEIKNPLHSMVINLEVLKRRAARAGGEGAEDLQRYAGVLGAELERVNRRIELLLRLSRPSRGADTATLGELVDELLELVQLEGRHHEVSVDYAPAERPARVRLPREAGRQMILNLVLDALENAGPGARLRLAVAQSDDEARLEVDCSGGEPAAELAPAAHHGDRIDAAAALAFAMGGVLRDGGPASRTFSVPLPRP